MIGPQPEEELNCRGPGFPFLLPVTADYWLLYFCGWGSSTDGRLVNTTFGPEGELGCGAPGSFDDHQRSYPTIVAHEDEYRCWYTGNGFGSTGIGYAIIGRSL